MGYNEAIIIRNVKRYGEYDGYSKTLKFKHTGLYLEQEVRRDVIAMDAFKFEKAHKDQ